MRLVDWMHDHQTAFLFGALVFVALTTLAGC